MISMDLDRIGIAVGIEPSEREWLADTVRALQGESSLSEKEVIARVSALLKFKREDYHDLKMAAFVSSGGNPRYYGRKFD